jgi:uncharacterized DUF497 family protein
MSERNIEFEWDDDKAARNRRKHRVDFEEAKTAFDDPHALVFDDEEHSHQEQRELLIGYSNRNRILLVAFVLRFYNLIRIISARLASRGERKKYEQEKRP